MNINKSTTLIKNKYRVFLNVTIPKLDTYASFYVTECKLH